MADSKMFLFPFKNFLLLVRRAQVSPLSNTLIVSYSIVQNKMTIYKIWILFFFGICRTNSKISYSFLERCQHFQQWARCFRALIWNKPDNDQLSKRSFKALNELKSFRRLDRHLYRLHSWQTLRISAITKLCETFEDKIKQDDFCQSHSQVQDAHWSENSSPSWNETYLHFKFCLTKCSLLILSSERFSRLCSPFSQWRWQNFQETVPNLLSHLGDLWQFYLLFEEHLLVIIDFRSYASLQVGYNNRGQLKQKHMMSSK